jgi:type IV secretion system protein TrbI
MRWRGGYLRHDGPEHVPCFALTRSGKGVGLVVPTLLTWPDSAIAHDIKGENWTLTTGWRSRFGCVLLFDPTNAQSPATEAATPGRGATELTSQDYKLAFLNGNVDHRTVNADHIAPPPSPYVLQAGAVIPAALLIGIRSDLPGQVTAHGRSLKRPTGKFRLIPQGARLIGQYDAQIAFGQTRALSVDQAHYAKWAINRIGTPAGADAEGYSGLEDEVDNHWVTLFKAAILSTLLSIGAQAGTSGHEDELIRTIRHGSSESINQVGQRVVGRALNVQPMVQIAMGSGLTRKL